MNWHYYVCWGMAVVLGVLTVWLGNRPLKQIREDQKKGYAIPPSAIPTGEEMMAGVIGVFFLLLLPLFVDYMKRNNP